MNSVLDYDRIYSSGTPYFPPDPLPQLLKILTKLVPPARCLDLGSGEGRDSMLIASHGHAVTAVDSSSSALASLAVQAKRQKLKIAAHCKDIQNFNFPKSTYDFIYSRTFLDHIPFVEAVAIAKRICVSLKMQGNLLVEVFSINDPGFSSQPASKLPQSELATLVRHYFTEKELFGLFGSLHFISLDRCFKYDNTHGRPHFHETLILSAKKACSGWKIRRMVRHE